MLRQVMARRLLHLTSVPTPIYGFVPAWWSKGPGVGEMWLGHLVMKEAEAWGS